MSNFVVWSEFCNKEQETFLFFLQYDGNEDILNDLHRNLCAVDQGIYGDNSIYCLDIKKTVSEKTAKNICKVNLVGGYRGTANIIYGKCKHIPFEVTGDDDKDSHVIDGLFYNGRVSDFFYTPEKIEREILNIKKEDKKLSENLEVQFQELEELKKETQKKKELSEEMKKNIQRQKKIICDEEARQFKQNIEKTVESYKARLDVMKQLMENVLKEFESLMSKE